MWEKSTGKSDYKKNNNASTSHLRTKRAEAFKNTDLFTPHNNAMRWYNHALFYKIRSRGKERFCDLPKVIKCEWITMLAVDVMRSSQILQIFLSRVNKSSDWREMNQG